VADDYRWTKTADEAEEEARRRHLLLLGVRDVESVSMEEIEARARKRLAELAESSMDRLTEIDKQAKRRMEELAMSWVDREALGIGHQGG
jgi:hypothetical protein